MRAKFLFLLLFLCAVLLSSFGQVSQGGFPMETPPLKKAHVTIVEMPRIDNNIMLKSSMERYTNAELIKPLQFAHTFDVNFHPENS